MSSHSPVPWHDRDDESCTHPVLDDSDFGAVRVISDVDYAHALHCVNAHDALVAACEAAEAALSREGFVDAGPDYVLTKIRAVLAARKGEQP